MLNQRRHVETSGAELAGAPRKWAWRRPGRPRAVVLPSASASASGPGADPLTVSWISSRISGYGPGFAAPIFIHLVYVVVVAPPPLGRRELSWLPSMGHVLATHRFRTDLQLSTQRRMARQHVRHLMQDRYTRCLCFQANKKEKRRNRFIRSCQTS